MTSPGVILLSLGVGVYFGLYHPEQAQSVDAWGAAYISLLKMIILPFLISAIPSSISKLLQDRQASQYVSSLALVFPLSMLAVGALSVGMAVWMGPGHHVDESALKSLGQLVQGGQNHQYAADLEMSLSGTQSDEKIPAISAFVTRVVPDNIFAALSDGDVLKVLIFAISFGIALGFVPAAKSAVIIQALDTVSIASQTLMKWINILLPLALAAMVASQVAKVGLGPLTAMVGFITTQSAVFVAVSLLCLGIIWRRSRRSLRQTLRALQDTIVLAATTRSSLTCIPVALDGMTRRLRFDPVGVELILPLGTTLCRYGPIVYYAVCTIFIAELYQIALTPLQLAGVAFGSVLAAMASAGTTGALTITMVSLVCLPLGLPVEAAIVLFIAVDPIIDIYRTILIVLGNCTASSLICRSDGDPEPAETIGYQGRAAEAAATAPAN